MDQPLLMSEVQCLGDRGNQLNRFLDWQPRLFKPPGEIGSFNELRNDVAGKLGRAPDIMHRHNIRVIEIGDRTCFGQVGIQVFLA